MSDGSAPVSWEFRRQAFVCSEALLRILRQARETHGDDLESTVIYLAIVCGAASGLLRDPQLAAAPPAPGRLPPEQYGGVSRRQIAASTGLPRETVRRKIAALLERGEIVAVGARVRVRPGLLEDSRNAAFAQTLLREFARAGAQVRIP
jgi:hypothetical protein